MSRIIIYHVYIPVHVLSYCTVLASAHISSTTKFGPNSACLNPDYVTPVSFIGQIHVVALNKINLCISVIWFHLTSIQFQLSAVQSFNESHVSGAGENGCYLSVLVSISHLQGASSLELFSNQKSLNSQDSCDVKSAATQTLARKHTYICNIIYIWLLIKIPLSRNGHSSRIKNLLSRNFRELHVYLSRGPCWPTTPLMKIRSPPANYARESRITSW